ncbi:MAG: OmpA family protein [Blastocatellia bacterium]|nr:OmpA family protein [Blastocatellia bacterium]
MNRRLFKILLLAVFVTFAGQACATKKYVRKTLDERIAPLEGRTAELEQSVQRNTSAIKEVDERLSRRIDTVTVEVDKAKSMATEADRKAVAADNRAKEVGNDLGRTKGEIDNWVVAKTTVVYFDTNRYKLRDEAKAELDAIATMAKSKKSYRIEIAGFADRRGGERHNVELTENRAREVRRYLFNVHKLDPWKMQILDAGKIDDGAKGKDALQQNRRVDVRVLENAVVKNTGTNG